MKSFLAILATVGFISATILAQAGESSKVIVDLAVTENGFEPNSIDVKPGSDVVLKVTRKTDSTCAKEISVPSKKIKKALPLNTAVNVGLGRLDKGEIKFACGMNMISGVVVVK